MKFVVIAGLLIVGGNLLAGERGLPALLQSRRDAMRLAAEIGALRSQNAALAAEIRALKDDPATIESIARRTLGLARRDEILVRIRQP